MLVTNLISRLVCAVNLKISTVNSAQWCCVHVEYQAVVWHILLLHGRAGIGLASMLGANHCQACGCKWVVDSK